MTDKNPIYTVVERYKIRNFYVSSKSLQVTAILKLCLSFEEIIKNAQIAFSILGIHCFEYLWMFVVESMQILTDVYFKNEIP